MSLTYASLTSASLLSALIPHRHRPTASGYAAPHASGARAASLVFNGGIVALLVALPVAHYLPPADPPTRVVFIPHQPPPEPAAPEPEPKPQSGASEPRPNPTPQAADPVLTDPVVRLGEGPRIALADDFQVPVGGGEPVLHPAPPVLVAARPDPRFADAFRPLYPAAMRREGLEGRATVRLTIDERGRVIAVELVSATHPAFFEETRRQALTAWRFRPATRDGAPVASTQTMTVRFKLEG